MPVKQGGNRNNKGQFKSGQSGNPQGRPKKELSASDLIRAKGDNVLENGKTELQEVIDKLYEKAKGGDLRAIEMIFDRIEGKPIQATITSTKELPDGFNIVDIG